jgi:hypothetical protein
MRKNATPLVLICGWMNASRRGVIKYTELYDPLRFQTIVLESHVSHLFLSPSAIHASTAKDILKRYPPSEELVIIPHMISNGGCITWVSLEKHLVESGVHFHVPGMIFDSAPNATMHGGFTCARVLPALDYLVAGIHSPVKRSFAKIAFVAGWISVTLRWALSKDPLQRNIDKLIIQDAKVPKLFLYSHSDRLVLSDQVEKAIEGCKSLGTDVESVDFQDSEHVAHFWRHPDRYRQSLTKFLDKILERP